MKIEERIGEILKNKNLTLSTAESCTGGGIAALITSVPGSSQYFNGGVCAYQNFVKSTILKVPQQVIDEFGVVSEETVVSMVKGAMESMNSDCAVSTSGIAGPSGGSVECPVGTIWIAVGYRDRIITFKQQGDEGRKKNIKHAIRNSLVLLEQLLK